jgi:hypothetical protein
VNLELYRSVLADKQSQIRKLKERKVVIAGGITAPNDTAVRIARLEREVSELKTIVAHLERVASLSAKAT